MKDSEFPSFVDEEDDAQATMMWDRDEVDLSDLDLELASATSQVKPRAAAPAGLSEGELFGDLPDETTGERPPASIPVEGELVQTKRPPPPAAPEALQPVTVAQGKARPKAHHWGWAVGVAAVAGVIASLFYVLAG